MRTYTGTINHLQPNQVFVFGSNTQGRHGKGAAMQAMKFGAIYGEPAGIQGQTYAIVTKDLTKKYNPSINRFAIIAQIVSLYIYANKYQDSYEFLIAYSGTGDNLNGYTPVEMAQMFIEAAMPDTIPKNIIFEESFAELITNLTS